MGSVYVKWSGGCADAGRRDRLSANLATLGKQSHGYFTNPPALAGCVREAHRGRIVIDRGVFALGSDLSAFPTAFEAPPAGRPLKLGNPMVPEKKDIEDDLIVAPEVVLDGTAFHLYDGRNLYPDDVVSFVFASFPGHAHLGWRLVKVEDREKCQAIEALAAADLYLGKPQIHLRYYCEEWMDWLLAAVKVLYVADLAYWRYEDQPGFDKIAAEIAELDPATAEETVFAYLGRRLDKEVEAYRETAAQATSFWSAMRAAVNDETK